MKKKWVNLRDNTVRALKRKLAEGDQQAGLPKEMKIYGLPNGMDWYIPHIIDNVKKRLNAG